MKEIIRNGKKYLACLREHKPLERLSHHQLAIETE